MGGGGRSFSRDHGSKYGVYGVFSVLKHRYARCSDKNGPALVTPPPARGLTRQPDPSRSGLMKIVAAAPSGRCTNPRHTWTSSQGDGGPLITRCVDCGRVWSES